MKHYRSIIPTLLSIKNGNVLFSFPGLLNVHHNSENVYVLLLLNVAQN